MTTKNRFVYKQSGTFSFKWSLLDPSTWLNIAILVAPLRLFALGSLGPFTLSFFRVCLLIVWATYLLKVLATGTISVYSGGRRVALLLGLMLVATLVPVLYSPSLMLGDSMTRLLVKLLGWLWVITIIFVVQRKDNCIMHVRYFVLSSIIPMIIGWYQTVSYYVFGNTIMPLSSYVLQGHKLFGVQYNVYMRPSGTFLEPNYYGMFLSMVAVIALANIVFAKQRILSPRISYLILGSAVVQLFATMSVSALIGFGFGLVTIGLAYLTNTVARSSIIGPLLLVAILSPLFASSSLLNNIISGLDLKLTTSIGQAEGLYGRESFFEALPKALEASNGMGVGYGGLIRYVGGSISTTHSAYLTVLGEQGILAFLILLLLTISICLRLVRRYKQIGVLAVGLVAAFISLITSNFGYDAMFSFDASWTLIGLAAAVASLPVQNGGNND